MIAGNESSVVAALAQRSAGGTAFRSGAGLGRHLGRIDSGASAWALVDVTRLPAKEAAVRHAHAQAEGNGTDAAATLVSSMKSVSLLALQATAKGDALKLSATGLASDEETAGLMEDALRGVLAAWRLAAQEKSPETVADPPQVHGLARQVDGLDRRHAPRRHRPRARREEARAGRLKSGFPLPREDVRRVEPGPSRLRDLPQRSVGLPHVVCGVSEERDREESSREPHP